MKSFVAIFVTVLFGLAAAQTASPVTEDAHLMQSNRTAKFLDFPDPVLKLFKPALMEKMTTYGNQAMRWFNTLDRYDVGLSLAAGGIVGIAVSFLVSSLVWISVHVFGFERRVFNKWLQKASLSKIHPKPVRTSRVLDEEVDDVTAKVYQAIEKFLEQKSD